MVKPLIVSGALVAAMLASLPRAVRNNNPVNIRISKRNEWAGEVPEALNHAIDDQFETFLNPAVGYRAAAVLLRNYYKFYGLNTIDGLIKRFAPIIENPTDDYIQAVSTRMGVERHQALDLNDDSTLANLLVEMHRIEAGLVYFGKYLADAGVRLAGSLS